MRQSNAILTLLLLLLLTFSGTMAGAMADAMAWRGKCVTALDGDTLRIKDTCNQEIMVHLYGIDAPERGQCFGRQAQMELLDMLTGEWVEIQAVETDGQGNIRALVKLHATSDYVNRLLVAKGLAWVEGQRCGKSFCSEWKHLETNARDKRTGLWYQEAPIPPWEWRAHGESHTGDGR